MSKLLSDLVFQKRLPSQGHKIFIRNETSHTIFSKSDAVILIELKNDGLIIEMPTNVCQKSHLLTLFFFPLDFGANIKIPLSGHLKEAVFEAMGKVENLEVNQMNSAVVYADIHFTQYDSNVWTKLLESYSKNQDEMNEIILKQRDQRDDE